MCAAVPGNGNCKELSTSLLLESSSSLKVGVPLEGAFKMPSGSPEDPMGGPLLSSVLGCADGPGGEAAGTILPWNILISTIIYAHEVMRQHYHVHYHNLLATGA